jgi:glutaconate CoA-transferase, subunit A
MNCSNKVMSLKAAVEQFVQDGAHISLGGFTIVRNPMGLAYEIIRQKKKDLHVYVHSHGLAFDLLIGAGCVKALEVAYGGIARFSPAGGVRFRKAVEAGTVRYEDYSNYQMVMRFLAGAIGVPFLPLKGVPDTDVVRKWGFDENFRSNTPGIPSKKLATVKNPFADAGQEEELVVVPAIHPDVTLIHVQKADAEGTCRIEGLTFADVEQAKAAKCVIATCETLIPRDEIRREPDRNQIPFFIVDAVVPLPYGAYPTACYRCYDYDDDHLMQYADAAAKDDTFQKYLDRFIYSVDTHEDFLNRIGKDRLDAVKADPVFGYRPRAAS